MTLEPAGFRRSARRAVGRMMIGRVMIVGVAVLAAAACDDDGPPTDQPATTVPADGSATTIPGDVPTGGTGDVEPGTNLVPTSDDVPGPSAPSVSDPNDTTLSTGG